MMHPQKNTKIQMVDCRDRHVRNKDHQLLASFRCCVALLLLQLLILNFLCKPSEAHQRVPAFVSGRKPSSSIEAMASASASASASATASIPKPPVAPREEDRFVIAGVDPKADPDVPRQSESSTEPLLDPGVPVADPYGWLRDESRSNQTVLDHLKAENEYTQSMTSHLAQLRETLYQEMLSAIQETDHSLPRPRDQYVYYSRTIQGKSYELCCRAPHNHYHHHHIDGAADYTWDGSPNTPILPGEEIMIDINQLAEGQSYCDVVTVETSPSHKLVAYTVDYSGDEIFQLVVMDLQTKQIVDSDQDLEVSESLEWGNDDTTLFYTTMDEAHRPYRVFKRQIAASSSSSHKEKVEDQLLFEELDDLYEVDISKSLDGKYLFIEAGSQETSEIHFLDLTDPEAKLQCIAKRRKKVLYEVEHRDGLWWITSNVGGTPNLRLMTSPAKPDCQDEWKDVVLPNGEKPFDGGIDRALDDIVTFKSNVVLTGREGGIPRVWILYFDKTETSNLDSMQMLTFDEPAHDVGLTAHYEFDTDKIVVAYDSMITPLSHIEISFQNLTERTFLKQKKVPGYNKADYGCDRVSVLARDGKTQIPVSLVYRKDVMQNHIASGETVPVHLYGYGSYGSCEEADFSSTRLTLLNRGVVYVIAHVRGGGELGRQWYEEPNGGKYLCKKNTFNDFCDVAKWLSEQKLTEPNKLSCEGRSAGGLLIGASINQEPELFHAAILGVPFVDVMCTMIDAKLPLTAGEWEEWGCPNEKKFFQYMREYSPVNNVQKKKYPSCLLIGGLHDPRVAFWEPAKLAAELRHTQSEDSGPVCLKMEMIAGHFSASDRYKYLRELAFDFAFLLDQLGLANVTTTEAET